MSVRGHSIISGEVETTEPKDIANWVNVGVTVDSSGATGAAGDVEGSRGMGSITDVWETIMAIGDPPQAIDDSFRRIRLNITAITNGDVVCEVSGN